MLKNILCNINPLKTIMAENVKENSNKIIVEEVMEDGSMNTMSPKCFVGPDRDLMKMFNLEDIIYPKGFYHQLVLQ